MAFHDPTFFLSHQFAQHIGQILADLAEYPLLPALRDENDVILNHKSSVLNGCAPNSIHPAFECASARYSVTVARVATDSQNCLACRAIRNQIWAVSPRDLGPFPD